ncbi:hypothetical protein JCM8202_002422 [Rhodotorula sphaerocarpa]
MLLTRIAITLVGLAATALSTAPASVSGEVSASAGTGGSVEVHLQSAIKDLGHLRGEVKTAIDGVNQDDAKEIFTAVSGLEITAAVSTCAKAVVDIAGNRNSVVVGTDVQTVAGLVVDLIKGVLDALAPIKDLLSSRPLLGTLLTPLFLSLGGALAGLLNVLFSAADGLLKAVLSLLDGSVAAALRVLGLGSVSATLNI